VKRTLQGNIISHYPDFTIAVQEARKKCTPIKPKLRQANISYAMLYTTCLLISHRSRDHVFTSLQQAGDIF
ncbi:hypothetical protein NDU88_006130, partial [Pleurodeles waltl]